MDTGKYSRDINEIDEVLSSYIASQVGSEDFDRIRKEFLKGFEIGWKFTRAQSGKPNSELFAKIQNKQVTKMVGYGLKDKPYECGMAFGIVVSSLRNNPYYIFATPVSLHVYTKFFEIVATKKSEFKKYLYDITIELQRNATYISRDWNENQKSTYLRFLARLFEIVS